MTTIPQGSPVDIVGCLVGWSWCDAIWAGYRGWVAAAYLNASWQGATVPFVTGAPRLGVPAVVYDAPTYWRTCYAGTPWFVGRPFRPVHGCVRGPRGRIVCR